MFAGLFSVYSLKVFIYTLWFRIEFGITLDFRGGVLLC